MQGSLPLKKTVVGMSKLQSWCMTAALVGIALICLARAPTAVKPCQHRIQCGLCKHAQDTGYLFRRLACAELHIAVASLLLAHQLSWVKPKSGMCAYAAITPLTVV